VSEFKAEKENEFVEIVVPAGSLDTLSFRRSESHHQGVCWIAKWPDYSGWDKDYYQVYSWKGDWAFSRPEHPLLGRFRGATETTERAMVLCAQDYEKVCRLERWRKFMTDNEPPETLL
jgi:hypothetical protein